MLFPQRMGKAFSLFLALAACGGATTLPPAETHGDGGGDGSVTIAPGTPCSVEGVTGTMPGVSITIRSAKCRYSVGEPAELTYEVTTDASLPPLEIAASQGCGSCRTYTDDPLAFTGYDIDGVAGDGSQQHYCVCDTGCCAPDRASTIKLTPAKRTATITWSGRNWYGPSDTGNQEGAFFPPGHYSVRVTFASATKGVQAVLPIEIVP